jgi:hypothetical protein
MHMKLPKEQVSRRRLFAGAGAAGALAAAATVLPLARQSEVPAEQAKSNDDKAEGYRLTEHIQRYYETAKV